MMSPESRAAMLLLLKGKQGFAFTFCTLIWIRPVHDKQPFAVSFDNSDGTPSDDYPDEKEVLFDTAEEAVDYFEKKREQYGLGLEYEVIPNG